MMKKSSSFHPAGPDVDDPNTTILRRSLIAGKPFLRRIYAEWYHALASRVPAGPGQVLEIGSGPGFLEQFVPGLITSELLYIPGIRCVQDAQALGLAAGSLKAILMVDVLHHLPNVRSFFTEARRCLRPGGRLVMIEPWNSPWAAFIYRNFHPEPFEPGARRWEFASSGPLSGANGALAWMIFRRDLAQFEHEFPTLKLETLQPFMPVRYLLSGGLSRPGLVPAFTFPFFTRVEGLLKPWANSLGMFCLAVLRKE